MTTQTKKATENEVNSLLLGSGSNKRISIDEQKTLWALRLGDHEDKKTEERIPLKVWKMTTPEANIAMRSGEEVKVGIVKDSTANMVKHEGGKMSQQQKKASSKFLRLTEAEENKNDASYIKSVDEFITECSGPSLEHCGL